MTEASAARVAELLKAHDEDLRTHSELDRATDLTRIGPLWLGRYAERGFVTYSEMTRRQISESAWLLPGVRPRNRRR